MSFLGIRPHALLAALLVVGCGGKAAGDHGSGGPVTSGSSPGDVPGDEPLATGPTDARFRCEPRCTPTMVATRERAPHAIVTLGADIYWTATYARIRFAGTSVDPVVGTLLEREPNEPFTGLVASGDAIFAAGRSRDEDDALANTLVRTQARPPANQEIIATSSPTLRSHGIFGPVASGGSLFFIRDDGNGTSELASVLESGGDDTLLARITDSATAMAADDLNVYVATRDLAGNLGLIVRVAKATGAQKVLTKESGAVVALAAGGGEIFWASSHDHAIKKMAREGGAAVTLAADLKSPRAIAIGEDNVFWLDEGSDGADNGSLTRLPRANAQPAAAVVLVSGLPSPSSLVARSEGVYWTNLGTGAAGYDDGSVMMLAR